ncbi:MAG TPA: F0F1 ATP synthase subunit epsilon [Candidatus Saccharimonadales bacterium]|jgi:F0F1-type ATP synthase epsilon subunit|nr:F0F1 ATP synthase subunit epsilon [Candidatus Saccharimonadales bacterium]
MIEEKTASGDLQAEGAAAAASVKDAKPTMHIKVYSPFHTYYDQDSYSISGTNRTGPFDILPHHHNFMSLLEACELQIRPLTGPEQRIRISGGLMNVKADQVTVFLDI